MTRGVGDLQSNLEQRRRVVHLVREIPNTPHPTRTPGAASPPAESATSYSGLLSRRSSGSQSPSSCARVSSTAADASPGPTGTCTATLLTTDSWILAASAAWRSMRIALRSPRTGWPSAAASSASQSCESAVKCTSGITRHVTSVSYRPRAGQGLGGADKGSGGSGNSGGAHEECVVEVVAAEVSVTRRGDHLTCGTQSG